MAKQKVVWTETAVRQRRAILKYWTERNQSTIYAEKLIELVKAHLNIILKSPESFKATEFKDTRESAMGHFSLYYKISDDKIIVVAFWDNRQNPKKLLKSLSEK